MNNKEREKIAKAFENVSSVLPITTKNKISSINLLIFFLLGVVIVAGVILFSVSKNNTKNGEMKKENKKPIIKDNSPAQVIATENLEENLPDFPEVIAQGKFVSIEQEVLGKALFLKSSDKVILRFEDFSIVNGQNIHVYLSPISNLEGDNFIDLGLLKATSGDFNYEINKSVDISKYKNVIIWSNTFGALFGYAGLYEKELQETPIVEEKKEESVNSSAEITPVQNEAQAQNEDGE